MGQAKSFAATIGNNKEPESIIGQFWQGGAWPGGRSLKTPSGCITLAAKRYCKVNNIKLLQSIIGNKQIELNRMKHNGTVYAILVTNLKVALWFMVQESFLGTIWFRARTGGTSG